MAVRTLISLIALSVAAPVMALTPEARIAAVSYRLQTRAVELCAERTPMASFFIKDADSALIDTVVPDGPADHAGLRAGDHLAAINGTSIPAHGVSDLIDRALDSGTLVVQVADRGLVQLKVELGCGYSVSLDSSKAIDAYADGTAVALSTALVDFTRDDDELALVMAHELSHNILRHKAQLDAAHVKRGLFASFGKSAAAVRKTEEEADVYALYLMARAGYDINKAPTFWKRFGSKTGAGVFSDSTHLRTKARVALAEATLLEISEKRARCAPLAPAFTPPQIAPSQHCKKG